MSTVAEMSDDHWKQFDIRLTEVEKDIASTQILARSMASDITEIKAGYKDIANIVSRRGQTNWGIVATMGGVFGALLVFYTNLVTIPIKDQVNALSSSLQRENVIMREADNIRLSYMQKDLDFLHEEILGMAKNRWTKEDQQRYEELLMENSNAK